MNIQQEYHDPSAELRPATEQDLATILTLERTPAFHTMVGIWPEQEHRRAMRDPDVQYSMIVNATGATEGFAILRGLASPHRSIELKRFVVGAPGKGIGQRALRAIIDHAFRTLHAHRLWLDVFESNARALHIYRKAGFQQEGVLREAIYRDGEFHTLLLLSILDREYLSQPAR